MKNTAIAIALGIAGIANILNGNIAGGTKLMEAAKKRLK